MPQELAMVQSRVLTLMVTLTEDITRWVQSWDQLLTIFPPKASTAWESDAWPSLSKHDEHTTGCRWTTLTQRGHGDWDTTNHNQNVLLIQEKITRSLLHQDSKNSNKQVQIINNMTKQLS